tara:strand:- start:2034 stop:2696 length:663 start_codon:yes stop_codon:yes gene_type:complete
MFKRLSPIFFYLFVFVLLSCEEVKIKAPENLTISEGFKNPLGFYDAHPTFSWKLPVLENVKNQVAYQIAVASSPDLLPDNADLWDSEKQEVEQSAWIKYDGNPLASRQKVFWQVKYWNQDNTASLWSDINHFELGLLSNQDWSANWIGLDTKEEGVLGSKDNVIHRPQYLRKGFELSNDVASARLYITAKGVFDVAINGEDISDDVMPPGWTPYKSVLKH